MKMAEAKKEVFSKEQNRVADLAKALAHPARVAILQYLLVKKSCICGDLVEELPLSQSTISQHLKELKRVGIIQGTIEAPRVCYCIDPKVWQEALSTFQALLKSDCC